MQNETAEMKQNIFNTTFILQIINCLGRAHNYN